MEIAVGILGAGIGAGLMTLIQMLMKRKWERDDRAESKSNELASIKASVDEIREKLNAVAADVAHCKAANRAILSDRIKWLGTQYIQAGEVDFESRRNLHALHNAYHDDCGGNGDYKILMADVDELPLKR